MCKKCDAVWILYEPNVADTGTISIHSFLFSSLFLLVKAVDLEPILGTLGVHIHIYVPMGNLESPKFWEVGGNQWT